MGLEEIKTKPNSGSESSDHSVAFLLIYMICLGPLATGFSLKSCRVSQNAAICTDSQLKFVPQDIPPTVTGFDLSKNQISRIQRSDFTNLMVLEDLNLCKNHISKIDSGAFVNLISLRKLTLNNNKLVKLGELAFDGLGNLTELRLNTNKITALSPTAFQSLTRLILLDISQNKLETISNLRLILQHMPQLQELVIRTNVLRTFQSWKLTNRSLDLQALDLSHNPIRDFRVTANIFPNLTCLIIGDKFSVIPMKWDVKNKTFLRQLSSLDVSGLHTSPENMEALLKTVNSSLTSLALNNIKRNRTQLINLSCSIPTVSKLQFRSNNLRTVSSYYFKPCVNVVELDLSENHIKIIDENAFTSMRNLTTLRLSKNKLSSVPTAIRTLQNLSQLDLSNNMISTLTCQDFSNQTRLKELSLQNNSIFKLTECAFKGLVHLQILRLQSSQITDLKGAFKTSLPKLKQLLLNGNKLTAIRKGEFEGLKSLWSLSLHQNQIKILDKGCFVGLLNLTDIRLQSNGITTGTLKTSPFKGLSNLKRLYLNDNHIKGFNITPFSDLHQLEELSLHGQHYRGKSSLPSNFLHGLSRLLSFNARNSQLINVDKDTFVNTPNLERLDLSSNDLENLTAELFAPIRNLKSLYISRIAVHSLDFLAEANLTKLEFLQGRHNQYSVVTKDIIKSLPSLQYLDFKYNSFYCECINAWFVNWTIFSKRTQVNDAYNYSCNYPDDFKGKKLLDLKILKSCSQDVNFICFVSTTSTILFVMAASFIYHFMRWQLYYAYYLFLGWLFDSKYKNKQVPHQYDAFISYNHHDEPWVIGELLPKLEGEQGWKLCLHHRDFEPGKPITQNITDAIYGSRKTICVISRRYLESEWCSREVQTASFRLFDEQKDVLILVFLEDIPTYLLSPFHRMRKLLKKQTYLSWPRAADHPEVFWENLRKALQTGNDPNEENFLSLTQE
ncbi:toll-like receptor 13 isoform X1 [Gambusia affinis]|uniref:toll-like receptor 13 isoform X1 n=2 Tax=Gambusia affinis TaxID=33528 RepID=UPI001CDBCF39|nr:toll-like receptor 13 isoform X1 [Gambusia affinis]